MPYQTTYAGSPLGPLTLASDGTNLVGLWIQGQKYYGASVEGPLETDPSLPVFIATGTWLDRYFAGEQPSPQELPLAPNGSQFRQSVWRRLLEIPYGETRTYGAIAQSIEEESGVRASAQAVGGAVGHNPISIIIPCHRVVGSTGSLTGYAGGVAKKLALLRHEGAYLDGLFVPSQGSAL